MLRKITILSLLALAATPATQAATRERDVPWQTINWKAVLKEHANLSATLQKCRLKIHNEFNLNDKISHLVIAREHNGGTLLHRIAIQSLATVAARINDFERIMREIMEAREMAMTLLVMFGADIDARDADGATPLHRAALAGYTFSMNVLLDLGADINARSTTDSTPLHCAVSYGNKDATALLLERGADIYAKNCDGNTPLDFIEKNICRTRNAEVAALVRARYQRASARASAQLSAQEADEFAELFKVAQRF